MEASNGGEQQHLREGHASVCSEAMASITPTGTILRTLPLAWKVRPRRSIVCAGQQHDCKLPARANQLCSISEGCPYYRIRGPYGESRRRNECTDTPTASLFVSPSLHAQFHWKMLP
ncbi:hypothetical protein CERZMDRAFT_121792, partial [Cercospora zeae-maydis SCOH1-5]